MGKLKGIFYVIIGAVLLFAVGYLIFTGKKMGYNPRKEGKMNTKTTFKILIVVLTVLGCVSTLFTVAGIMKLRDDKVSFSRVNVKDYIPEEYDEDFEDGSCNYYLTKPDYAFIREVGGNKYLDYNTESGVGCSINVRPQNVSLLNQTRVLGFKFKMDFSDGSVFHLQLKDGTSDVPSWELKFIKSGDKITVRDNDGRIIADNAELKNGFNTFKLVYNFDGEDYIVLNGEEYEFNYSFINDTKFVTVYLLSSVEGTLSIDDIFYHY